MTKRRTLAEEQAELGRTLADLGRAVADALNRSWLGRFVVWLDRKRKNEGSRG